MTMKYTFLLLIMLIISVPLHAQDNAAAGNVMPEISAEEFDKMTKEEQSEFLKKQEEAVLKAVKEEENNQEKAKKNENIEESAIMQINEVKEKYSQPDEKEPAQAAKTEQKGKRTIPRKKQTIKKTALSGIVLMPTAYRGTGTNEIGPGLDINAAYIIGRLYGKNTYDWTLEKKDYLDRIGLWILSADGKLQVQTEGKYRPAVAAGVQGIFSFRDSSNPTLKTKSWFILSSMSLSHSTLAHSDFPFQTQNENDSCTALYFRYLFSRLYSVCAVLSHSVMSNSL